jgi:hypothetical protein
LSRDSYIEYERLYSKRRGSDVSDAFTQLIAEARAWQWQAGLRGDLCEYRSATAALQRACDQLLQAADVVDGLTGTVTPVRPTRAGTCDLGHVAAG